MRGRPDGQVSAGTKSHAERGATFDPERDTTGFASKLNPHSDNQVRHFFAALAGAARIS